MKIHDKTKHELIKELQKLQLKYDSLKTSYSKDISGFKQTEDTLSRQKDALLKLNNFSIGLSKLTLKDNLEAFIVIQLKEITGAGVAVFSEYNQTTRTITVKHIEIDSRMLKKAVSLLGQDVYTLQSEVSEELYSMMTSEIIGIRKTLTEATFGAIQHPVGAAVQSLLKADRFIGLAYIIEGRLYGTSLLAMSKGQSDPPREILENFISLAAVSLRRKKTEEAVQSNEQQYRLLMETSGLGIGYYSLDGKILMFNQQAIINLGGKAEDYIGKNVTEVFGNEAGQIYIDRFKLASASEKPLKFEDNLNLDDKPGWYMSTLTRIIDQNGTVDGIQVIADNITDRKIVEEKIKTSEAEYRSLFENSVMGISQSKPGQNIIRINQAYAKMYGYPDEATMLKELSSSEKLYSNPDDRKSVIEILEKSGSMPPTEFELNSRNGEKFWALVSARQVKDNCGKLLYLQAEHIDITDRKKLEKENECCLTIYTQPD